MTQPTRKLAAIVFTDIVEFTQITAQDEAAAMSLLKWQRKRFKPLVSELGGEWLKEVGDGLLLCFPSSQDAVRCAIRIQEAAREVPNLKMRIGIHQGDIIQEGPDILGDGVNIASRIQQVALRGGIALSEKVQQDISGYPEFEVISLGQKSLKGVARPMEIYALSPFGLPEIPEYRLLRLTGQGAYGDVWLAQSLTGVYRAVKIVHRDQFEDAKPYEREFTGITGYEPISRKHEGLIDLLHVGHGEGDNFFYYVMELADDQRAREEINPREYQPRTLQSELEARGKLSIGECLEAGSRLARGLAFLHDNNLLHRDIKPSNIVYVDGQPKLADIGLVTTMDNASTLVGTMGYIPPEGPGKPHADIYALGMVLYELSTGKDRADFPEIDVLDPELKDLNQVCLKACSRDTGERYPDAHAFADELNQLARGEFTTEAASSFPQSRKLKTGALAAALIAILALVLSQRSGNQTDEKDEFDQNGTNVTDCIDDKYLVAYYPFNGNAKDESGYGHDGEVKGPRPTYDRHSKADSAYEFTGEKGSRIDIGESDTLKLQKMTLNAWVYLSKEGADEIFVILQKGNSFQWTIDNTGKSGAKNFFGIHKGFGESWANVEHKGRIPTGEWFMFTATYDGSILKQFLNSIEICSLAFAGGVPHGNSQESSIFAGAGKLPRSGLTNKLDDLRIYNRALSTEDVVALYMLEKPKPFDIGLLAYYPFNGNAGDASGNGHDPKIDEVKLTVDRHGKTNKAASFTAEGAPMVVDISNIPKGEERRTISLWAKADLANAVMYPGQTKHAALVEWGEADIGQLFGLIHHLSGPTWMTHTWGAGHILDSTINPDDHWHHLVGTYQGGQATIFVDGILRRVGRIPANTGFSEVVIGASTAKTPDGKYKWPYVGDLDDIRIYNRVLSIEEVKELYELEGPKVAPRRMRVITVGGSPIKEGKVNGGPDKSLFFDPHDIAVDPDGNAFISEHWNHDIRKISAGNYITSKVAGNLLHATGLGIDPAGNLYVTRFYHGDIIRITPDGQGKVVQSGFTKPSGVCVDGNGTMWVANTYASQIIRITPDDHRTIWKGMQAHHIALGPKGDLYVACQSDQTVRRIGAKDNSDKAVEIVAGKPNRKGHIDGPVAQAIFTDITGVTVSASGNIYVGDNSAIRRISPEGQVSTIAGDPMEWSIVDGPADKVKFGAVAGLAIDSKGNLWMAIRDKIVCLVINAE